MVQVLVSFSHERSPEIGKGHDVPGHAFGTLAGVPGRIGRKEHASGVAVPVTELRPPRETVEIVLSAKVEGRSARDGLITMAGESPIAIHALVNERIHVVIRVCGG